MLDSELLVGRALLATALLGAVLLLRLLAGALARLDTGWLLGALLARLLDVCVLDRALALARLVAAALLELALLSTAWLLLDI